MAEAGRQELSIKDYVALLRRRKWIVIAMVVLVPVCAAVLSMRQPPVYQSTATVATPRGRSRRDGQRYSGQLLLRRPEPTRSDADRAGRDPQGRRAVLRRAKVTNGSPDALLGSTSITANPNADLLYFTEKSSDPTMATLLANAYATQYTVLRSQLDTQTLLQARTDILEARRRARTQQGHKAYAASSSAKAEQLQTLAELETSERRRRNPGARRGSDLASAEARRAHRPRPRRPPRRWARVPQRRVSTRGSAGPRTSPAAPACSLLARIPEPPRKLQRADELVMFEQPASREAEAFRVLRTNIDFAGLDRDTPVDHGHERARARGQVDDDREPRGRRRPAPASASCWSISTCAGRGSTSSSSSTAGPASRTSFSATRTLDEATARIAVTENNGRTQPSNGYAERARPGE